MNKFKPTTSPPSNEIKYLISQIAEDNVHDDFLKILRKKILRGGDRFIDLMGIAINIQNAAMLSRNKDMDELFRDIQDAIDSPCIVISTCELMDKFLNYFVEESVKLRNWDLLYQILYILEYNLIDLGGNQYGEKKKAYLKLHKVLEVKFFS